MISWRTVAAGMLVAGGAAGLVTLYLLQRDELAAEADMEEPVVAPSRVRLGEDGPVVVLDSAESRRIGLETAVLESASATSELRLPGEVVEEPERVSTLRAPLAGRLALAEGGRWPSIGERVSAGAPLAQVSDARPLTLPFAGIVTRVGARPGEIVDAGQMLLEVVDRSRPVVRVVWSDAAGGARRRILLAPEGGGRVPASLIGPAAEADPLTRRPAYLYRARRGWPGSSPGTTVAALVPVGPEVTGALVPDRAVVQWDGLTWVYRSRGEGRFERRPMPASRPVARGWLVTGPLAAGDTVVVTGAQELLSEEFRSRVTVGDESGE